MTNPKPRPAAEPSALSYEQASTYTGLGRTRLYHAWESGELRSLKVGSRRLFLRDDLDAFLASAAVPAAGDIGVE